MDLTLCSDSENCIHKNYCLRSTLKDSSNSNWQSWCDFKKMGCNENSDYDMMIPIGWSVSEVI
jgi:hypothetical protein